MNNGDSRNSKVMRCTRLFLDDEGNPLSMCLMSAVAVSLLLRI